MILPISLRGGTPVDRYQFLLFLVKTAKNFLSGFISFSRLFLCVFCFNPSLGFYEQLGLFLFSLLFEGKSASRVVQYERVSPCRFLPPTVLQIL